MILLGVACLSFAVVLAWFSAPAAMALTRTAPSAVDVSLTTRMFGLVPVAAERIDGAQTVKLVRSRISGSSSHTPDQMVFVTADGLVDRGYRQQLFAPDFLAIRAFFDDPAQATTALSSIARGSELRRFLFAQAATMFLAVLGASVLWMVVRSIFPPPHA